MGRCAAYAGAALPGGTAVARVYSSVGPYTLRRTFIHQHDLLNAIYGYLERAVNPTPRPAAAPESRASGGRVPLPGEGGSCRALYSTLTSNHAPPRALQRYTALHSVIQRCILYSYSLYNRIYTIQRYTITCDLTIAHGAFAGEFAADSRGLANRFATDSQRIRESSRSSSRQIRNGFATDYICISSRQWSVVVVGCSSARGRCCQ